SAGVHRVYVGGSRCAWQWHRVPRTAVPVHGHDPVAASGAIEFAHRPYIVGGHAVHRGEGVVARANAGRGHDAPRNAVPVHGKGALHVVAVDVVADGPHVVGGDGRYIVQHVVVRAGVGAGYNAPRAAVPVL